MEEHLRKSKEQFINDYDRLFKEMMINKELISGSHPINKERADLFINSQLSERRRRAAKNLIDNTHYFTFNFVYEKTRDIIYNILTKRNKNNKIVLFVSNLGTSFYFISMIVYYFIQLYNLEEPLILTRDEANQFSLEYFREGNEIYDLIILDDCIYSGGQMCLYMKNLMYYFETINIGASIITEDAYKNILEFFSDNVQPEPKIYAGIFVKSMTDNISKEDFMDILYYFNPHSITTKVSIYLDYKIADHTSTFITPLLLGPVLPSKIKYDYKTINRLYDNFREYGDYKLPFYKLIEEEKLISSGNDLSFIPFIEGIDEIKLNPLLNIPYYLLVQSRDDIQEQSEYYDLIKNFYDKDNRFPKPIYKII